MKIGIILCFFLFCINGFCQVLSTSKSVDWTRAGYKGTFPDPYTIVDIQSFGGSGDGSTDNSSAFTNALNSLNGNPGVIYFPSGIYFFSQPLYLAQNVIIRGESNNSSTLRFNLNSENHLIIIAGSTTSDTALITSDVYKDSSRIEVNNPGLFAAGDHIRIFDNDSSLVTSSWALYSTGQINQIDSVVNNDIYLSGPLRRDYYSSLNAGILKLNLMENAGIENLKIERLDSTVEKTNNIYFSYAVNCWVDCIESSNCNFTHVDIRNSSNIEVKGSYFHDAFNYGSGGKAYGVMIQYSSGECLVENNIFDSLRHSMIVQAGANGNVFAYNYSINPHWTEVGPLPANFAGDLVMHGNYPYANLFEGNIVQNIVIDNSHGINGKYNTLFRNRAELYGIFMNNNPPSNEQNFIGNEITNTEPLMGNYILNGTGHFEYGNNVLGTIIPSGTNTLSEQSYYMDTIPSYYQSNSSWPPIGIPNTIDAFTIEAKERYDSGNVTRCSDSTVITGTHEYSNRESLTIYPNPAIKSVKVKFQNKKDYEIARISVVSLIGKELITVYGTDMVNIEKLNTGIYFIIIRLSEDHMITRKLIVYGS